METALVLTLIALVYGVAVLLFIRFFAFIRSCDSEMRTMVENRRMDSRFPQAASRKRKTKKTRAPRVVPA